MAEQLQTTVPAISVKNVRKYFKDVRAVDGIDFEINPGEFVALLGPNGAGKTTLVEMIEGIQKQNSGEIRIMGMNWQENEQALRRILGISLQETYFFDKITVLENLKLFASFYELDEHQIRTILEMVDLTEKKNVYISNLSGGQRQKLALGIALLHDARILLLDEPTTGLDPTARREIWNILTNLKTARNTTLILTTHYMEEAEFLCDRIIIIDHGKILSEGTLDELLSQQNSSEIIEFSLNNFQAVPESFKFEGIQNFTWDEKTAKGQVFVDRIVDQLPLFLSEVNKQKLELKTLECRKVTLDDLFISMTGRHLNP